MRKKKMLKLMEMECERDVPLWRIKPENVERLRAYYSKGARVKFVHITNPFTDVKEGDIGIVDYIDDEGSIYVDCETAKSFAPGSARTS